MMLIFGLTGLVIVALMVLVSPRARRGSVFALWVSTGCVFVMSSLSFVAYFLDSDKLFVIGIVFPLGVLSAFLSVENLRRYRRCTVQVEAWVKELAPIYRRRGVARYAPLFFYRYLETNYEELSFLHYRRSVAERLFSGGEQCVVWIDPCCPENCVDKRKSPRLDWLLFVFALAFLALSVFLLCMPAEAISLRV